MKKLCAAMALLAWPGFAVAASPPSQSATSLPFNLGWGWEQALSAGAGGWSPLALDGNQNLNVNVQAGAVAQGAGNAASPWYIIDNYNAPFAAVTAMTPGTAYSAGRSVQLDCTGSGAVSMQLSGGGAETINVIAAPASQILPFAVTQINVSGTTATCTYRNLN
jgi:hypothetical protein